MKIVKAKSGRRIWRYWFPRRLTLSHNPPIYAWLWWNITRR